MCQRALHSMGFSRTCASSWPMPVLTSWISTANVAISWRLDKSVQYRSTSPRLQDPDVESACRSGCQDEEIGNVIGSLIFIAHCYVQDERHGQMRPRHTLHVSLYVVLEDEYRSLLGCFQRHPSKFKVVCGQVPQQMSPGH